MAVMTPIPLTFLVRVGNSDVLNDIGTAEIECVIEEITDRRPDDAPDADYRITRLDIPGALRKIADEIEAAGA